MTQQDFEQRVIAMRKQLFYVSYSMLPNLADQEDAVQECIHKALVKRETLRNDAYFSTWIIRILINVCHEMGRKKQREFPTEDLPVVAPATANGEVFEAIMALDAKYRLPLVLHHHTGYSVKETAHILRVPEGTIKSRLARGRAILEERLYERGAFV